MGLSEDKLGVLVLTVVVLAAVSAVMISAMTSAGNAAGPQSKFILGLKGEIANVMGGS